MSVDLNEEDIQSNVLELFMDPAVKRKEIVASLCRQVMFNRICSFGGSVCIFKALDFISSYLWCLISSEMES